jgi:ABC-type uncharacterized transport system involved in gliding motility auxiliary subunit
MANTTMKMFRGLILFLAGSGLLVGLNFMVLQESLFSTEVIYPLGFGAALFVLWLILYLVSFLGRGHQGAPHGLNTIIGSIAFLGVCVMAFAFIQRWDVTWDLTQEGRRELAPQTIQVLESLTEELTAYCLFIEVGDERSITAQQKTIRFLERCQQYTDQLVIEKLDPQVDALRVKQLEIMRLSKIGAVVLESENRKKAIPLTSVSARLEERDFTNALINVSRKVTPMVYFLGGHKGRDISNQDPKDGGHMLPQILLREAYKVAECVIPADAPRLPEDCSLLIINNYEADLLPYEIEVLDQYLDNGGRLLVLTDVHLYAEQGVQYKEQLRPWLKSRFGIDVVSDILISPASKGTRINIISDFRMIGDYDFAETPEFRGSFHAAHPITRTLDQFLVLDDICTVRLVDPMPEGVTGMTILRSTPDTWGETNVRAVYEGKPYERDGGDTPGPSSVAVAVAKANETPTLDGGRSNDTRIVVLGDSDISSNQSVIPGSASTNLLLNTIAWLTENDDLIAIRPTGQEELPLILSDEEQRAVAWLASLAAVQIIGLAGFITWAVRRKNQ